MIQIVTLTAGEELVRRSWAAAQPEDGVPRSETAAVARAGWLASKESPQASEELAAALERTQKAFGVTRNARKGCFFEGEAPERRHCALPVRPCGDGSHADPRGSLYRGTRQVPWPCAVAPCQARVASQRARLGASGSGRDSSGRAGHGHGGRARGESFGDRAGQGEAWS